jgi:hypothetical protein
MPITLGILAQSRQAAVASDFVLLETQVLGTATASVTFSGLSAYASTYKHLQIRTVARTAQTGQTRALSVRFNADTGTNYSWHFMGGDGSSVSSNAGATQNFMYAGQLSAASISSDIFAPSVIDILDAFNTSKAKTLRALGGDSTGTTPTRIRLFSGAWYNTNALSSITLLGEDLSSNFAINSRFSLYGVK